MIAMTFKRFFVVGRELFEDERGGIRSYVVCLLSQLVYGRDVLATCNQNQATFISCRNVLVILGVVPVASSASLGISHRPVRARFAGHGLGPVISAAQRHEVLDVELFRVAADMKGHPMVCLQHPRDKHSPTHGAVVIMLFEEHLPKRVRDGPSLSEVGTHRVLKGVDRKST